MIDSTLVLGIAGFAVLQLIYFAVREAWPVAYYALSETYALTIFQRTWRLIVFRFFPGFLVAVALVVTSWRTSAYEPLVLAIAVIPHLLLSNVKVMFLSAIGSESRERVNYTSFHLLTVLTVVLSVICGAFAAPWLTAFVPAPADFVQNLWFAGFVAVVGAALLRVSSRRESNQPEFSGEYFLWRARRDVGVEILDSLFDVAVKNRVDPYLLKAILVSEVLQRPKWFRALERVKGLVLRKGSYGVMQMASDRPISDQQSLDAAAKALEGVWCLTVLEAPIGYPGYTHFDEAAIWSAAGRHNGDKVFIRSVIEIYQHLFVSSVYEWPLLGGTVTKVVEIRRYADHFALRVVTNCENLVVVASPSGVERSSHGSAGAWRSAQLDLPPGATSFTVTINGQVVDTVDLNEVARAE